ncbi:MAG: DUF1893 domain-containing protein [Candidatus Limivicinus sp.]|jgi:hypothetical protein
MNKDLEKAKKILAEGEYTCTAVLGDSVITSRERGVKPLLNLIDAGRRLSRYSVADRVIGKAAAYLYVLLDAKEVYADVMSRPALEVFRFRGIPASQGELAQAISNRTGTGLCPMESAVMDIDSPKEAEKALRIRLRELNE